MPDDHYQNRAALSIDGRFQSISASARLLSVQEFRNQKSMGLGMKQMTALAAYGEHVDSLG